MQRTQPHADFVLFAVAAIGQRHFPVFGKDAENIFELVDAANGSSREGDQLIVDPQAAAIRVGLFLNLRDDDRPVRITRNRRAL